MEVREIMSTDLGVCRKDETIRAAAQRMQECDCGAVPVVDSEESMKLVGLITDRDIAIRGVAKGLDPNTTRVTDCMSTHITWVRPTSMLSEVENIMENLQVRRVPVVDELGKLCGIVSMADIALSGSPQEALAVVQEVSRPTPIESAPPAFLS